MTPKRIQRKRTKGWKMPEGAVYVGRPSKWGNHHRVGDNDPLDDLPMDRAAAVYHFWRYIERLDWTMLDECRTELRGKDLACWCPLDALPRPVVPHERAVLRMIEHDTAVPYSTFGFPTPATSEEN